MSFKAMEDAIVARLTEKLGSLVKKVYTAGELTQVEETKQFTPNAHVIYNGYAPSPSNNGSQGKIQGVDKAWIVVVSVRNAQGTQSSAGARDEASPIIDKCLAALLGWRAPIAGEMPLALSPAPGASFSDAGFAYYPIAFTNGRTYRGED